MDSGMNDKRRARRARIFDAIRKLNAFNAIQAVIKWKKLLGFYCDLECEHHSTYTVDGNLLLNEDQS